MSASTDTLSLALQYAAMGWSVLPLAPGEKRPAIRGGRGVYDATTDLARIRSLWTRTPALNVGIACGAVSGLLVLDVDPRNGGDETLGALESRYGRLPPTPCVLTPGPGQHYYFALLDPIRVRPALGDGIDVKGDGGYVVAPPSAHPNGGRYQWDAGARPRETPLAAPPPWLLELLLGRRRPPLTTDRVGDAGDTFLSAAFAAAGWLGHPLGDGKIAVRCPWLEEHSSEASGRRTGDGSDSSAVLMAARSPARVGAFHCLHGHCHRRTTVDVLRVLPRRAVDAAARAYPCAFRVVLGLLAEPVGGTDG